MQLQTPAPNQTTLHNHHGNHSTTVADSELVLSQSSESENSSVILAPLFQPVEFQISRVGTKQFIQPVAEALIFDFIWGNRYTSSFVVEVF